jgi:ankyrin repeat protein
LFYFCLLIIGCDCGWHYKIYINWLQDKNQKGRISQKKNYYVIEKLLNLNNVNINIQTNIGETPLHIATNYEDTNIFRSNKQKKSD